MNLLLILPPAENIDHVYERSLSARFPELTINVVERHDQVGPHVAAADILMTFSPMMADHVARDAQRLQWIQVLGSGVDGVIDLPSLRPHVLITNGHGVQAIPVSEAALGLMFALSRQLPRMMANQAARTWQRWPSQLLHARTVGIVGVGAIAAELARKCHALGMRVVGVSSGVRPVEGFDRIVARQQLADAVGEFDYLVLLTPYSKDTHHLVNAAVLSAMKPSAFLVNVARGGVLDEQALIVALRTQQIAGAALDVFEREPLPADSPLWSLPNLILSPHLAGLNSSYPAHIMPLLEHNLRSFLAADHDAMTNVVRRGKPTGG